MASPLVRILQAILPASVWLDFRQRPIIQEHQRIANYWAPIIAQWQQRELPHYELQRKKELPTDKIIWQYWGQGPDAPDLLR